MTGSPGEPLCHSPPGRRAPARPLAPPRLRTRPAAAAAAARVRPGPASAEPPAPGPAAEAPSFRRAPTPGALSPSPPTTVPGRQLPLPWPSLQGVVSTVRGSGATGAQLTGGRWGDVANPFPRGRWRLCPAAGEPRGGGQAAAQRSDRPGGREPSPWCAGARASPPAAQALPAPAAAPRAPDRAAAMGNGMNKVTGRAPPGAPTPASLRGAFAAGGALRARAQRAGAACQRREAGPRFRAGGARPARRAERGGLWFLPAAPTPLSLRCTPSSAPEASPPRPLLNRRR